MTQVHVAERWVEKLSTNAAPLWAWMNERHRIFQARQAGAAFPWSEDPIFQQYRFCNVFRELDTVTQWIQEYIRAPYAEDDLLPFMLCVARTINWPPTLKAIMEAGLWPTRKQPWLPKAVAELMQQRADAGEKVYTGAYMIRAESDLKVAWYTWSKHRYITEIVLGRVYADRLGLRDHLLSCRTLQDTHTWLQAFHGWGPFMAYEVVTDLRHTRWLDTAPDIDSWANAGPGALRGLNRLLGRDLTAGIPQAYAVILMQELLLAARRQPVLVPSLRSRRLELRDIEHSLCEMDKYLRVQHGEGTPRARYVLGRGY